MKDPATPNARLEALFAAGLAESKAGRSEAALAKFEAALALDPRHLGALVSAGTSLFRLGRAAEAEGRYRAALAVDPRQPLAVRNLCILLAQADRQEDAVLVADGVLASHPGHTEALLARGTALIELGDPAEAVACLRPAAQSPPHAYEALTKLGVALASCGADAEGLDALDSAIALRPDDPYAYWRRAIVRLRLGRYRDGWRDYEKRWRLPEFGAHHGGILTPQRFARLREDLSPGDLVGRRVLLVAEQGVGDQVMFASVIADVQRAAAGLTVLCDRRLVGLLQASFPDVAFGDGREAVGADEVDEVVAMGSLGRLYRNDAADFPGTAYLRPRPAVREAWARRLGPRDHALRIGLSWRGGAPTTRRKGRSIALAALKPLLDLPDCEVFSLQYGDHRAEIDAVNAGLARPVRVLPVADIEDFEDLAAVAGEMDLIVSVQTALVHLSGAIGADCLAMVPANAEWRYGASGATLPWYRSVRIVRQGEDRDWAPVIRDVADTVARRAATGRA